jgi:hypothetical protein
MQVICPKCSHVRPADATNPDWQCPACGICYAKFVDRPAGQARPARDAQVEVRHSWNFGWVFKVALIVVLGWGLTVAIQRREHVEVSETVTEAEQQQSGAGVAAANTILRVSEADASLLHSLAGRLEKACARNKYGLSEQACIARLREREDVCATKTAQRFPGQIGDTARMQAISQAYVGCIFESADGPV